MIGKDGRPLLTRRQLARKHRRTYSAIRVLHDDEDLMPVHQGANGTYWFDQADYEALKIKPQVGRKKKNRRLCRGEANGKAFDMFSEGASNRSVVREIRYTPGEVRAMRREYAKADEFVVGSDAVAAIRQLLEDAGHSTELEELPITIEFLCKRSMAFAEQATTGQPTETENGTSKEDDHQEDTASSSGH